MQKVRLTNFVLADHNNVAVNAAMLALMILLLCAVLSLFLTLLQNICWYLHWRRTFNCRKCVAAQNVV